MLHKDILKRIKEDVTSVTKYLLVIASHDETILTQGCPDCLAGNDLNQEVQGQTFLQRGNLQGIKKAL
jgi:hypothetical protein